MLESVSEKREEEKTKKIFPKQNILQLHRKMMVMTVVIVMVVVVVLKLIFRSLVGRAQGLVLFLLACYSAPLQHAYPVSPSHLDDFITRVSGFLRVHSLALL